MSLLRYTTLIFLLILISNITLLSNGLIHLRKHRHPMYSAKEEISIINAMQHNSQQEEQNQSSLKEENRQAELHNFKHDDACGESTLSCMAFAHTKVKMPVRCGMLTNAPVCKDKENHCSAFCDADGGARVCQYAFPKCCSQSPNGCTTSEPRHTKIFPLKKSQ